MEEQISKKSERDTQDADADKKALLEHYRRILATDGDEVVAVGEDGEREPQGLTSDDMDKMADLVRVLQRLKEQRK